MKPFYSLLTFVFLSTLIFVPSVFADDPIDNWCDAGGPWSDGRCTSEWYWTCGWYMVRFESGEIGRFEVNSACNSLLPPLPIEQISQLPAEQRAAICKLFPDIANSTACAGLDQTGTIDVHSDGAVDTWVLFVTNLPCSQPSNMPPLYDETETSQNAYWSDSEFAPLNLNAYNCAYSNAGP